MYSHEVRQIIRTHGSNSKILTLAAPRRSSNPTVVLYFDKFVYIVENVALNGEQARWNSRESGFRWCLRNILKFSSSILKILESQELTCLLVLTKDGCLWKLDLTEIVKDIFADRQTEIYLQEGNERSDIFEELLDENLSVNSNVSNSKQTLSYKPPEQCKVIQDANILDIFLIGKEILLIKKNGQDLIIDKLVLCKDGVASQSFVELLHRDNKLPLEFHNKGSKSSLIASGDNIGYIKLICTSKANACSSAVNIKVNLFSAIFSVSNALHNRIMLIFADSTGKVNAFPINLNQKSDEYFESQRISYWIEDKSHLVCDLKQSVVEILQLDVKNVLVKREVPHSGRSDDHSLSERELLEAKEKLENESALVIIGKSGKLLIILPAEKQYSHSPFNLGFVSGPVLSASAVNDNMICATGNEIHVSKLSADVNLEEGVKLSVSIYIKQVYTVNLIGAVFVSKNIVLTTDVQSICLNFMATNAKGCLFNVTIKEDSEKDNGAFTSDTVDGGTIQSLLMKLERTQSCVRKLRKSLIYQNKVLEQLQKASNIITNVLESHNPLREQNSQTGQSKLICKVKNVFLEIDKVMHLCIVLQNNDCYSLCKSWRLQCCIFAREAKWNTGFGSFKSISKLFEIHSLSFNSTAYFRWSLDMAKAQIILPFRIEFRLIIQHPYSANSLEEIFSHIGTECIAVPLNVCYVTLLNISNIKRDPNLPVMQLSEQTCYSTCTNCCHKLLPIAKKHKIPSKELHQRKDMKLKRTKLQIPTFLVSSILSKQCIGSSTMEDAKQIFLSYILPGTVITKQVIEGNLISLELPCKHSVNINFDKRTHSSTGMASVCVSMEGEWLELLAHLHSIAVLKLEKSITSDVKINVCCETGKALSRVRVLLNALHEKHIGKPDWIQVHQTLKRLMDVFVQCRSLEFI